MSEDIDVLVHKANDLKDQSRKPRDCGELEGAAALLEQAIQILEPPFKAIFPDLLPVDPLRVSSEEKALADSLADCYGSLGGIRRRQKRYQDSFALYSSGRAIEQAAGFEISKYYNQVQWLILRILLAPEKLETDENLIAEITRAKQLLRRRASPGNPWAYSDLGLLFALTGDDFEADDTWKRMQASKPVLSVYTSALPVLHDLKEALPDNEAIAEAVERFEQYKLEVEAKSPASP